MFTAKPRLASFHTSMDQLQQKRSKRKWRANTSFFNWYKRTCKLLKKKRNDKSIKREETESSTLVIGCILDWDPTDMLVTFQRNLKLFPKYNGPFQVIQRARKVAYKLDLASSSKIYPVFHIFNFKKKLDWTVNPNPNPNLLVVMEDVNLSSKHEKIIEKWLKK